MFTSLANKSSEMAWSNSDQEDFTLKSQNNSLYFRNFQTFLYVDYVLLSLNSDRRFDFVVNYEC